MRKLQLVIEPQKVAVWGRTIGASLFENVLNVELVPENHKDRFWVEVRGDNLKDQYRALSEKEVALIANGLLGELILKFYSGHDFVSEARFRAWGDGTYILYLYADDYF